MKSTKKAGKRCKKIKRKTTIRNKNTQDKDNYLKFVNTFNSNIDKMKDNDYIKFRDYSTNLISKVCEELRRNSFKDRNAYREFNNNRLQYLFTNLFIPKNNIKIYIKNDNYEYLYKTFNKDGLDIISNIVNTLNSTIVEHKYEEVDPKKKYNENEFKKNCSILDITLDDNKISFSKIRQMYNKKKEVAGGNEEELENINKAFLIIRNQYEQYLISKNI